MNAVLVDRAAVLSQLNERLNRASWTGGKKERNKAGPAETKSLGRMGEQSTIVAAVDAYFYLLLASNCSKKTV